MTKEFMVLGRGKHLAIGLALGVAVLSSYSAGQVHAPLQTKAGARRKDNGIHVGTPKVYDSRELTLMLDSLSQSISNKQFVSANALAATLSNIQGYQNSDYSRSFFLNGAVGPQAASVFAGAAGAGTPAVPGLTVPSVATTTNLPVGTSNVPTTQYPTPVLAPPAGTASTTSPGPQPPVLPVLQTAPAYTPTFGSNGSDLLSDEVNLTYQLYNVRMLLDRSLTDRLHGNNTRLQAVIGFDIDLEPDKTDKDAAAIVEVETRMYSSTERCDSNGPVSLVALMPEEGSHNAATLSQKATGFGGAIASNIFSLGISSQKRSQVFYLYRDMDTLSFQSGADGGPLRFGWQFRPVLGRRSVEPGMRHMMAVLGLPCSDAGVEIPQIKVHVRTRWERYDWKTQTTSPGGHSWLHHGSQEEYLEQDFDATEVPSTESSQQRLRPSISHVKWIPSDSVNGLAIITGDNFFPGTTVRLGGRVYSGSADGLTIKSDKELEVVAPLGAAAVSGVVSGRYGAAIALESAGDAPSSGFAISALHLYPLGNEMYQIVADLDIAKTDAGIDVTLNDLNTRLNAPLALVNGAPLIARPILSSVPPQPALGSRIRATTIVPAELVDRMALFTIVFPFAGPGWSASMPYYKTTLDVTKIGSPSSPRLLITATNPAIVLCDGWTLQFETGVPKDGSLNCIDPKKRIASFDIPIEYLQTYRHFLLTKPGEEPLIGDVPPWSPPPRPSPSLDSGQNVSVAQYDVRPVVFTGQHLDQIDKVLFDKTELEIVAQSPNRIAISLSPDVTSRARTQVGLLLLSDGHDPIVAPLTVSPIKGE